MKRHLLLSLALALVSLAALAQTPADTTLLPTREDGRQISTYAIAHDMLLQVEPECAYHPGMTRRQLRKWQGSVSDAMREIMSMPRWLEEKFAEKDTAPVRVSSEPRDGYTLEKWEFYPFKGAVSTFLVMIPEGAGASDPRPAMLCIPGSGCPKELLACEPLPQTPDVQRTFNSKSAMALDYVREGYIAVCVDNAATGEAADHEIEDNDDVTPSRLLLEMGWSWLGYTSYLDNIVLQWMKTRPEMRRDRIVVSGFSLGTEPMMVLGALDKDIYAFVYNDFLCQTQERALVMTHLRKDGTRPFPNSIRHLIPNYWRYFNFPDVVASFAPRPIIFTEGGLDQSFDLVRDAYRTAGAPEAASCHHYAKYADPKDRAGIYPLPGGLDAATYFHYANVDTRNHYFKHEIVLPWLRDVLK